MKRDKLSKQRRILSISWKYAAATSVWGILWRFSQKGLPQGPLKPFSKDSRDPYKGFQSLPQVLQSHLQEPQVTPTKAFIAFCENLRSIR